MANEPRVHEATVPILLVDDQSRNLVALESILDAPDYELVSVLSGPEALKAAEQRDFAVVLLDLMMPAMDGFATARALGRVHRHPPPIIFLTGVDGAPERVLEAYSAGAVDFIEKPLNPVIIRAKVAVFAELHRTRLRLVAEQERTAQALVALRRAEHTHSTRGREADEELYASEARFHQLVDAVTDYAIFMLDASGHVATWNPGAQKNKGYEACEIIGRHFSVFYTPEDRAAGKPEHVLETVRREGRFEEENWRARKDGSRFWANVVITALRDQRGEITGFAKVTRDLTAKRAADENQKALAREQLARETSEMARREMERVNRVKDEFLATMSHELRTPLNAIAGWSAILRRKPRDESKLERGLEVIERNARAQTRLVDDLLDVSRIINGKLQLNLVKTEVLATIAAAADVVRPAAEGKGVRLVVDIDPDVGSTMADAGRLQQIVWNLLTNAIRFTARGGRVTVTGDRVSAGIAISVRDTGAGIAAEHLPHIFERFKQIDSSTTRSHGGLGLGLAIVRHLVDAHGGTVEARSDGLGCGSSFTIVLPVRAVNTVQAQSSGREMQAVTTGDPIADGETLRGVRVLVVDDDADSLEILRQILEMAGAQVATARSANDAFVAIDSGEQSFEVIISDIGMPEVDGYSFIRRVRSSKSGANVPAIALTAYARGSDALLAKSAGYQEHLVKPVDEQRLLQAVQTWSRTTGRAP